MSDSSRASDPGTGQSEAIAALSVHEFEPTPVAVTLIVNFGIVAGRTPSRSEITALWEKVRRHVSGVVITVEHREEFEENSAEVCLDQVRIEVPERAVAGRDRAEAAERIFAAAQAWAAECIPALQGTMNLAERLAREAVVDR